jgi:fatty acid desaturase
VVTVAITLVLLGTPQIVALPPWITAAWIVATVVACCACHVVVHNHGHCPLFVSDSDNRVFNLFATVARGHCASDVFLPHNVNHHAAQGRPGDWIATRLGGTGPAAMRIARFVVRAALSMIRERRRLGEKGLAMLPEPFRSSLPREKLLLPAAIVLLLWQDWQAALLHALLPWGTSLVWLVGVNYVQHEDCDPESAWAHSRNFTGRFTNWLLFNNGYHSAHHLQPAVHWSELARLHATIADRVPVRLLEHSATRYMVRRFLLDRGT